VRVFERLAIDPAEMPWGSREQVANAMASRLLLPRRWFHKAGLELDWDLAALKDQFWTASHELIARRMLDMPPPVVVAVFDEGELTWRRGNQSTAASGLTEGEHRAWQRCHNTAQPTTHQVASDTVNLDIRCWPVHEPGWKREIMRTQWTACE
jgi:hypothetical protein